MNSKTLGLWCVFVALLFSSCSSVYRPVRVSTMTLTEAREVRASASTGFEGNDVQLAFAPIRYVGIYGHLNRFHRNSFGTPREERIYHRSQEAGLGFWYLFDNNIHIEASGGYGTGAGQMRPFSVGIGISRNAETYFSDYYSGDYRSQLGGEYQKVVLNAGLGWVKSNFDISFHLRYTEGSFNELRAYVINKRTGVREENPNWTGPVERSNFAYVDPVITIRGGFETIKFMVQGGVSSAVVESPDLPSLLFFSAGFSLDIKPGMFKELKKSDS